MTEMETPPPMGSAGGAVDEACDSGNVTNSVHQGRPAQQVQPLQPDPAVMRDWFENFPAPPALVSCDPDKKGALRGESFYDDFGERKLADAVAATLKANATRNAYFHIASLTAPTHRGHPKASKTDVAAAHLIHADLDLLPGVDRDVGLARITEVLDTFDPRPSALVDSGGGAQPYWFLTESVPINGDVAAAEEFERRTRHIEERLKNHPALKDIVKIDSTHDVCRIMRVPGSVNHPGTDKAAIGRKPRVATVAWANWDQRYSYESFEAAEPKQSSSSGGSGDGGSSGTGSAPPLNWTEVARHTGWLKSANDLPNDFPVKGRIIVAHRGSLSDLKAALAEAGQPVKYPGWSEVTFGLAAVFKAHGKLPREQIAAALLCDLPCNQHVHKQKSEGNKRYAVQRAVDRSYDPEPETVTDAQSDDIVTAMNQEYTALSLKGDFKVMRWVPDTLYPRQPAPEFYSKDAFAEIERHPMVPMRLKDSVKYVQRGSFWLAQPDRAACDGIDFVPGGPSMIEVPFLGGTHLRANTWRGFAVEPREGDCSLYLAHVRDNIAAGDEAVNEYILNWMADVVQFPARRRTAISLRGDPGDGKTTFTDEYGKLHGRHFVAITHPEHLIGRFNALEAQAVFISADEAAFAGDARAMQNFKTKITGETKVLEFKGVDPIIIRNVASFVFSTNAPQPLHIELRDRRYLSLLVPPNERWRDVEDPREKAKLRRAYFGALLDQMANGGREALLRMLLARDVSGFNPEAMPHTAEADVQKLLSADPLDAIVIGLATDGVLPRASGPENRYTPSRDHHTGIGLFTDIRKRGGRAVTFKNENDIGALLKRWGFERKNLREFRGWTAPVLKDLRAGIKKKYPATEFPDDGDTWSDGGAREPDENPKVNAQYAMYSPDGKPIM